MAASHHGAEHGALKVGNLSWILHDIATHHKISKDDLIQKIFSLGEDS
jgi:hypothetical protein